MFIELLEDQLRQYIDAESVFRAHEEALTESQQVRGGMLWRTINDARYLIRTSPTGSQKSLGRQSPELIEIANKFARRKQEAQSREAALASRLAMMQRLNRAQRVGRTPTIVIDLLQTLEKHGLSKQFIVVGTHALYAYETAAGVRISEEALATRDVDLLFDTRKRVKLLSTLSRIDSSMIGVLKRLDPSFKVRDDQKYTAVNKDGFEVDIIRRTAKEKDPHPLRMTNQEDDFWAVQVNSGDTLLNARPFSQVVIGTNGAMARMRTIHPLDFSRVKRMIANDPERDPKKIPKDILQADLAQQLVERYLPQHDTPSTTEAPIPRQ